MGNASTSEEYQKQFSSFLQRAQVSHIGQVNCIYTSIVDDINTSLDLKQMKQFFESLIEVVAPSYTESKRAILLNGWIQSHTQLSFSEIQEQINKLFVTEFSLTCTPLKNYCPTGVKLSMPALIQINTPISAQSSETPPLAVVCVLDRSGSMGGNKLKFGIRSICKVIKHLNPGDQFSVVAYDDNITVPIENGDLTDKASLKARVRAIRTGGCTNICDALTRASSILASANLPEQYLKRIYLFSDGVANAGEITTVEGLSNLADRIHKESNISISTFGLGTDYNEAVMAGIAKQAGGDYYFIKSAPDIPVTMSKAIHGLLSVYGTKASLQLRGQGAGIVSKLFGKLESHDLSAPIPLGDLFSNDKKRILVEIELAGRAQDKDYVENVCSVQLEFEKRCDQDTTKIVVEENLSICFTSNEQTFTSATKNNSVAIAQVMQQIAAIVCSFPSILHCCRD